MDDPGAVGDPEPLRQWFQKLRERAPSYGYNIKRGKCFIITKDERAKHTFKKELENGTLLTMEGTRYLGAPIGTDEFKRGFYKEKLNTINEKIRKPNRMCKTSPHSAAYYLYTRSVKHEQTYLQRVGLD